MGGKNNNTWVDDWRKATCSCSAWLWARVSAENFSRERRATKKNSEKLALFSLFHGGERKKRPKNSKKRPKNSTFKPLSTTFVPCTKI